MHCAEIINLEMVFMHVHIPPITIGNVLHGFDYIYLSLWQNIEVYLANSCLISNTWTVFQLDKIFVLKYFCGAPTKIYLHKHLTHEYFMHEKFFDLQYIYLLYVTV